MSSAMPGRNDPCTCGSGEKFKGCCLDEVAKAERSKLPPASDLIARAMAEMKLKQKEAEKFKEQFGVAPPISAEFKGHTFVAEGAGLRFSKKWVTYADFLIDEVRTVMGHDWLLNELTQPGGRRHPIAVWHDGFSRFWKEKAVPGQGVVDIIPNGYTSAFLQLGYELHLLRHERALEESLLVRLRHPDQFQGARYELFVAATMVKAGFSIEYEDETDATRKHTEFTAVRNAGGQKLSVEAKSRHRLGVLGYIRGNPVDADTKAGVEGLLRNAIAKPAPHPLVIFVDINLPPSLTPLPEKKWFAELHETIEKVSSSLDPKADPFSLLVFTNHPEHYAGDVMTMADTHTLGVLSQKPARPCPDGEALRAVLGGAEKYDRVPNVRLK